MSTKFETGLRAVVAARVSVMKGDEKTSHIAQHETGVKFVRDQGWTVAASVEDLNVSAEKVSPFKRPDLSPWLTEESAHLWDVLVFTKIDRVFRSGWDCVELAKWCKEHKKILVFVDDGLNLNYRNINDPNDFESKMAELFVYLGSFFAQLEANRFKNRALDTHAFLRGTDRWTGGIAPDGFQIVAHPSGKGRALATDVERKSLLHTMALKMVKDHYSFNGLATWLNEQGVMTNQDYQRDPEKRRGINWTATEVIKVLTSPATQGLKATGSTESKTRKLVLDKEGSPIQLASPTFDDESPVSWEELQQAIARRRREPYRTKNASPLLGVCYCGNCERAASVNNHTKKSGKVYRYYRCSRTPKPCPNARMRSEQVEAILEEEFLAELGNEYVSERIFVPAEDHTEELEKVKTVIAQLRQDRADGLIIGKEDEETYKSQMRTLLERRETLEQLPQRPAAWEYKATGETYAETWEKADMEERRRLLQDAGVKFYIYNGTTPEYKVHIPEDIKQRVKGEKA